MGWDDRGGGWPRRARLIAVIADIARHRRNRKSKNLTSETLRRGERVNDPKKEHNHRGQLDPEEAMIGQSLGTRGCAAWDTFGMGDRKCFGMLDGAWGEGLFGFQRGAGGVEV